jgi:hypothetical protein
VRARFGGEAAAVVTWRTWCEQGSGGVLVVVGDWWRLCWKATRKGEFCSG